MANYVEKENVFLRIAKYLIPWKGDKPTEIFRKIIFLGAVAVLVITLAILVRAAGDRVVDNKKNEELAEIFHGSATVQINTEKREELEKIYPTVQERFLPLLEINEDVIGWLSVGDPEDPFIDYVVMQCADNDFYLTHNFRGEESKSGAIFADYHAPITPQSQPANVVLYGHNMTSGEYFGKLPYYFNYARSAGDPSNISFYKQNPTITFSTLYETSTYKIFGGILTNTKSEAGEVFRYHTVRNFKSKAEFDDYCANILDRSNFINPDVNLKYGDELLTLSTCMPGYGDAADSRWVIFARKVREGEDPSVDVEKAFANPSPLFYDLYYQIYDSEWEGRGWSEDIIQGYKSR